MGFSYNFRQIQETTDVKDLVDFIASQNNGYPRYDEWVQKTESELFSGQKSAIMAFDESRLIGDLIYQKHKSLKEFLEIKNLRVHPRLRLRDFGKFMLKQVEVEARPTYEGIICDTRPEKRETVSFLLACGYSPINIDPLYDKNIPDISFVKPLKRSNESKIFVIGRDFIKKQFK